MIIPRFVFGFVLLSTLVTASPTVAQDKIRVGSWNIEHLGSPGNRFGDAKNIAQKPQDLAGHIKTAGVHVLALQEIGDTDNPGRRSQELDATFAILNAAGEDWTYELTPNKNPNDTTQLTGVAWNRKRVNKVGTVFRFTIAPTPQSTFNHWDRHPSAFKFSAGPGKTDFVVVALHLKAGSDDNNKKQRQEEMEGLQNALGAIKTTFKEEDIILIGDTNVRSTDEAALKACTDAGFTDLNADGLTTVPWGDAPFDHIFLSEQPEFAGAALTRVVTDNEEGRRKLSDHFLIHTEIQIQNDDDDNPAFGNGGIPGPTTPEGTPSPAIRILAVLPDPVGSDEEAESVTIANGNALEVSLDGWKLRDKANNTFNLSGTVPASSTLSIRVRGNFSLNQNGDEVRLINPAGQVVHTVSYTAAQVKEGKFITFGE